MRDGGILILKGREVQELLAGREAEMMEAVRRAYVEHGAGHSSLPHSVFLRFPGEQRNRIIALPAYLGGEFGVAGIKWVSSFPANVERGLDRASAVVVLNSTETGQPEAFIEGSVISAKRTAASAALAAQALRAGRATERAGVLGCGLINFEVVRFLLSALPGISGLDVFDIDARRATAFKEKCEAAFGLGDVRVVGEVGALLGGSPLISMATTAVEPHISDLTGCQPGATILHVSLRDLTPVAILACDNVVDDVDHVCRAQTSVHLAEQLTGSRDFIRCTLADILRGDAPPSAGDARPVVFSPFGVGVLDLAVGKLVLDLSVEQGRGTRLDDFLPDSWAGTDRAQAGSASK
jgi:ornithine cyclodeaminase